MSEITWSRKSVNRRSPDCRSCVHMRGYGSGLTRFECRAQNDREFVDNSEMHYGECDEYRSGNVMHICDFIDLGV